MEAIRKIRNALSNKYRIIRDREKGYAIQLKTKNGWKYLKYSTNTDRYTKGQYMFFNTYLDADNYIQKNFRGE